METGLIIITVISVVVAMSSVVYILLGKGGVRQSRTPSGVLHVDCSNPDYEPGMLLSLSVPVSDVIDQKQILLSVNVIRPNSRK